jgi:hypothetical protein
MRQTLTCEKCGSGRFWCVQMNEHAGFGRIAPLPVGFYHDYPKTTPYGRIESLLCQSCGFAVWYGHSCDPEKDLKLKPQTGAACLDCGATVGCEIGPVEDRDMFGKAAPVSVSLGRGHEYEHPGFASRMCVSCGRMEFTVDRFDAPVGKRSPCVRCGQEMRSRLPSMVGESGAFIDGVLHVYLGPDEAIGYWDAEVCVTCQRLDWMAQDWKLVSSTKPGVKLVERQESDGGPYR